MKIFDSFRKKGRANDAVETEEIQDQAKLQAEADISSRDTLSSAVRDQKAGSVKGTPVPGRGYQLRVRGHG